MTSKQRNREENFRTLELVAEKKTTNANKNATNYRIYEGARIQKKHGQQSIENVKYKTKMTRPTLGQKK